LEEIHTAYGDRGVKVLIIDTRNEKEPTGKVMDGVPVTALVLLDDQRLAWDVFNIIGTPTTLIVDSEGRAIFKHIGYSPHMDDMMSDEIDALLQRSESL
jgi:hypothetical protein